MKRITIIVAVCMSIFLIQNSNAQDFKEVLKKTQAAYQSLEAYHVNMTISVYDDENVKNPTLRQFAEVKKSGDNFHYKLEETEVLLNQKYLVTINNASKEINYKSRKKGDLEEANHLPSMGLDSLLELYETPEYLGEIKGLAHYRFFQKQGGIDRVDLFIDKESHFIKVLEYVYNPEVVGSEVFVRIQYEKFQVNPVLNATLFSEQKYFTKRNGAIGTTEKYSNYRLVQNSR